MFLLNGLILHWGKISPTNEKGTVTGLLFTTSNYSVILTYDAGTDRGNYDFAPRVYNKTASGFDTYQTRNPICYYIAIGY